MNTTVKQSGGIMDKRGKKMSDKICVFCGSADNLRRILKANNNWRGFERPVGCICKKCDDLLYVFGVLGSKETKRMSNMDILTEEDKVYGTNHVEKATKMSHEELDDYATDIYLHFRTSEENEIADAYYKDK